MKHRLLLLPILFLFVLSFVDCAKRGRPSGGKKDSIPPVIVKSSPENYSINFNDNEIKIYFDEYIKLKNLGSELIISPPLKYPPSIYPLSTGKFIKIKILDTLKENTTYSFNFGNSIVDNNEENAFKYYKYVFSTGNYIDSLQLKGSIKDALLFKPESPTTVMLYEVNETFNDSVVLKEKPTYITTTKDTTQTFELSNLKAGKYLLIALKEKNNDYIFHPNKDKIGFVKEYITIPTDSTYEIILFKEAPQYKIAKPKHETKNHIIFGFQGTETNEYPIIKLQTEVSNTFESILIRDIKTDTLHYWFKPPTKKDTLIFTASYKNSTDTLITRMRDLYVDTLQLKPINSGIISPKDTLVFIANTPLVSVNPEKIQVLDKDSTILAVKTILNPFYNTVAVAFNKTDDQSYSVQLLPEAVTDFFGKSNDTLYSRLRTKPLTDYATLELSLKKVGTFPIIVQLVNIKFKVIQEKHLTKNNPILFEHIKPGDYFIRIVYDENKNGVWDSGNFLQKRQAEKIIYFPKKITARANWSLKETFTIN